MNFLYVHWHDSKHVYKLNRPSNFTFDLPSVLTMDGTQWEVAVLDYTFKSTFKTPLYLLTDICEDSYIHGTLLPVLRRLDTKTGSFVFPQFIKVSKQEVQSIKIQVKDRFMQEVDLQDFYCTLCLRRIGSTTL